MCRLMAVPAQMKRGDVLDILLDMESRNTDGFGFAYTQDGHFVLNKTAASLTESLKRKSSKYNIWNNFPNKRKGWTIFHMRAATHGEVCAKNSHPFVAGNTAWVHNGVFKECDIVRAAMGKTVKFESQTDSEVALHLFNRVGPKKFVQLVNGFSVYLALNKDGSLWAMKTAYGADLKIGKLEKGCSVCFLSSTLPYKNEYYDKEAEDGWYFFNASGKLVDHAEKKDEYIKTKRSVRPNSNIGYRSNPIIQNHSEYESMSDWGSNFQRRYLEEKRLERERAYLGQSFSPQSKDASEVEMPLSNINDYV